MAPGFGGACWIVLPIGDRAQCIEPLDLSSRTRARTSVMSSFASSFRRALVTGSPASAAARRISRTSETRVSIRVAMVDAISPKWMK